MKCPKCGHVWDENENNEFYWSDHFERQAEDDRMTYICDECGKETHVAYARRDRVPFRSHNHPPSLVCQYRTIYLCVDCLMKHYPEDVWVIDRDMTDEEKAEYEQLKEEFKLWTKLQQER